MRGVKRAAGKGIGFFLESVRRLFLDTAPLIYYVENHPQYIDMKQVTEIKVLVLTDMRKK